MELVHALLKITPKQIPDLNLSFQDPGSRIQGKKDSGSRIRTHITEFKYFYPKKPFLSSRKNDLGFSSRIQIKNFFSSRIVDPDRGTGSRLLVSKKHPIPDPGSGSATLLKRK
jgi:hypothetical protein